MIDEKDMALITKNTLNQNGIRIINIDPKKHSAIVKTKNNIDDNVLITLKSLLMVDELEVM